MTGLVVLLLLIAIGVWVIYIVAAVKVLTKAGYSGWWVLAMFLPLIGWVFFFVFAFSDWPVQRELRYYRQGGSPSGFHVPAPAGAPAVAAAAMSPAMPAALAGPTACSRCGRSIDPSDVFCGWCGAPARPV